MEEIFGAKKLNMEEIVHIYEKYWIGLVNLNSTNKSLGY